MGKGNGFVSVPGTPRTWEGKAMDKSEIRAKYGFLQFDEPEMLALLTQAGFAAHRHYPNMGHNTQRMAFIATRAARD